MILHKLLLQALSRVSTVWYEYQQRGTGFVSSLCSMAKHTLQWKVDTFLGVQVCNKYYAKSWYDIAGGLDLPRLDEVAPTTVLQGLLQYVALLAS